MCMDASGMGTVARVAIDYPRRTALIGGQRLVAMSREIECTSRSYESVDGGALSCGNVSYAARI